MRKIARPVITVASSVFLIEAAMAAELTGTEIKELISDKTVYLELTPASGAAAGQGVIYYAPDGTALYRTMKGDIWHGTWTIKDNTACPDWKELPNNPCTRYHKQGDVISIINVTTGRTRGKILKTALGNAEKLVP